MTCEEWENTFKPIEREEDGNYLGETYGTDLEIIKKQNIYHVWTLVDGEDGLYIIPGMRYVNRMNYILTEEPWSEKTQGLEIRYDD